jgi:hypothetical protein
VSHEPHLDLTWIAVLSAGYHARLDLAGLSPRATEATGLAVAGMLLPLAFLPRRADPVAATAAGRAGSEDELVVTT